MSLVQEAFQRSHGTYGYRRITLWLRSQKGLPINGKAVLRLMNKLGSHPLARRRRVYRSLEQVGAEHTYPNRLQRDFAARAPNQKWVTDVTYIRTRQGWAYLSVVKDLFDGFIVAHHLSRDNSIGLVLRTLQIAKQRERKLEGLLLHSDQGSANTVPIPITFCSIRCGIAPSMSRRGNCWDNAPMENFFSHLKEEALRPFRLLPSSEPQRVMRSMSSSSTTNASD